MAWAMQDESVKVQMFRFIDVLPMLNSSDAVTRHLHEYFDDVKDHLPSAVRLGMAVAAPHTLAGRALALTARRNAQSHARRFIAGVNTAEVLTVAPARAKAEAGVHARHPGRSGHQRGRGRALLPGLSRSDSRRRPHGQRLARGGANRSRSVQPSCRASTYRSSSRRSTASSTPSIPRGPPSG